jgi:hypothetical protein
MARNRASGGDEEWKDSKSQPEIIKSDKEKDPAIQNQWM